MSNMSRSIKRKALKEAGKLPHKKKIANKYNLTLKEVQQMEVKK